MCVVLIRVELFYVFSLHLNTLVTIACREATYAQDCGGATCPQRQCLWAGVAPARKGALTCGQATYETKCLHEATSCAKMSTAFDVCDHLMHSRGDVALATACIRVVPTAKGSDHLREGGGRKIGFLEKRMILPL
ncbi:hypothetical protein BHM03_00037501 [Ensete ventricosum]|nr:hypothetical protein BHM03_00037501 [Ensete ventricosum]